MKKIILILILLLNYLLISADWYNPNINYLKLISNRSGLTKVNVTELKNRGLSFIDSIPNGFHIIHNSIEIPYYFYNGDIIYYIPSPESLNQYSDSFVCYVYYNKEDTTSIKTLTEANNSVQIVNYLEQEYKLEVDKTYFTGWDPSNYAEFRFKEWYWSIFSDYPGNVGTQNIEDCSVLIENLCLFPNKDSLITISASISTPINYLEIDLHNVKRKISCEFNNDLVGEINFDTLSSNLQFTSNFNSIWGGLNDIKLTNVTADTIKKVVKVGLNSILISGYFSTYLNFSSSIFSNNLLEINSGTKNLIKENSTLKINGITDSLLYIYDTLSGSFLVKKSIPTTHISVSTRSDNILTNILINNESYKSSEAGIHIAILPGDGTKSIDTHYFQAYNQDVLSLLENLSNNSVVCIAINNAYDISDKLKNYLSSLGMTEINSYKGGNAYICSYKLGNDIIMEQLNNSICSKIINFDDSYNRWFMGNFNLIGEKKYSLVLSDGNRINNAFVNNVNYSNLRDMSNSADLVIIYHSEFSEKSLEYAKYKEKSDLSVTAVNIEDIYKEFNCGNKSPYVIKDFLRYAYNNWKISPKYALFIGDASNDPRHCDSNSTTIDYIPTFGYPSADYWFGVFNSSNHNAEIAIGRFPVANNTQLENCISKIIEYENNNFDLWNKKFMFVNGGLSQGEIDNIKNYAWLSAVLLTDGPLCTDTISFSKTADSGLTTINKTDIINNLNRGVMMTIFHGHGSILGFDNWGWQVDNLNNINKYGILATMSCNTGIFADSKTQSHVNENFLLSYKDKGFVAVLGSTTEMTIGGNSTLQYYIVEALNKGHRRIGDIVSYAKSKLDYNNTEDKYVTVSEYNFGILGDPTLELKIDTLPDMYVITNEVIATNENNEPDFTTDNKEIKLRVPINNAGINYHSNGFNVKVESNDFADTQRIYDICKTQELYFTIPLDVNLSEQQITIKIDNDSEIIENNKENNTITKTIKIFSKGLYPIEPLPNFVLNKNDLHFRFLKWQNINNEKYEFYIFDELNNIISISTSNANEINFTNEYVDWKPTDLSLLNGNYFVYVKQYSENALFSEIKIPFSVADEINFCDTCGELLFISENNNLDSKYYLRGDTIYFKVDLANISLRTAIENIVVTSFIADFTKEIEILEPEEHIQFIIPIATEHLATDLNFIYINIISEDLYDFNNNYGFSFYIIEDTTKPTFEIYFDNDLVTDTNIFISNEPTIDVILNDNSNLPVLVTNPISVRLNGVPLNENNTDSFKFVSINEGKKKATLRIKPYLLTEKENLFSFYGVDGTGNKYNIIYRANIIYNNNILLTQANPTPSTDGNVNIKYSLTRSELNSTATVNIYDIYGKHIIELNEIVNNRLGIISWNQTNKNGNKVAIGTYFYILEILGDNYIEPIFGKIEIAK